MKSLIVISCLFIATRTFGQDGKHLSVGDTIPSFSLLDQDGKFFSASDHKNKDILVIFFYPKDDASISTKQVNGFKDKYAEITEEGALVVGINPGSVESHKSFHQKNSLPFPLLSDKNLEVTKQFGVKTTLGNLNRETYIVDEKGKIVFLLDSYLDGSKHAEEVLKYLKNQ